MCGDEMEEGEEVAAAAAAAAEKRLEGPGSCTRSRPASCCEK